MRHGWIYLWAWCLMSTVTILPAQADTIQSFSAQGQFRYNSAGPAALSGTMSIDTTTGAVVAAALQATGYPPFTVVAKPSLRSGSVFDDIAAAGYPYILSIGFNVPSLVAYTGGPINSDALVAMAGASDPGTVSGVSGPLVPSGTIPNSEYSLGSGSLTALAAVPEPVTAVLLGVGVIALGLVRRNSAQRGHPIGTKTRPESPTPDR